MNILLVDDEPYELEQLTYLIGSNFPSWGILTALDGIQALQVLLNNEVQLAVLDIELPGKSGLSLAKEIKQNYSYVTIIMLSAYQDFNYARRSIQIGVEDYLTKPIIEKELNDVLKKYVKDHDFSNIVLSAINYIHENYHEKINLSSLAEEIHVNPSYLSRKFHQEIGMKFSDYILDYRIKISKEMLIKNKAANISSVADKCGFNSLHYFSTVFKRKVKITPKEYREEGYRN
ncbi:response regulator transcription factor [Virgibacillus sp. FSP13]